MAVRKFAWEAKDVSMFGLGAPMKRRAQRKGLTPTCAYVASSQCLCDIKDEILPIIGAHSGG